MTTEKPIGRYEKLPPQCRDYDARAVVVAADVASLITAELPEVVVEHVGSTAVPGCPGKGVVDLMVVYPPARLEAVKEVLDRLGFQHQASRDRFPEDRPMRLGSFAVDGERFPVHAHVLAHDSNEVAELREFRDALRADPSLRAAYVTKKRAVLASGVTDSLDYSYAKGGFISDWVSRQKNPPNG